MAERVNTANTYTPDNLIGGCEIPLITKVLTVASGAGVLARGTVLGVLTTGGKAVKVDSSKSDGSQTAYGVLAESVDATSADVKALVYTSGLFNASVLAFGGTDTAAKHEATLRGLGIFLTDKQ